MEKIIIFLRTKKNSGTIKLRFRLREGREVDLYHKSGINAELKDLTKFDESGNVKSRIRSFNKELKESIDTEIAAMHNAYRDLCKNIQKKNITGELFEDAILTYTNPDLARLSKIKMTMLQRYKCFIEEGYRDGIFGKERMRHYRVLYDELHRYLLLKNLRNITSAEFSSDMLMDFRYFLINEYMFVNDHRDLYKGKRYMAIPNNPETPIPL